MIKLLLIFRPNRIGRLAIAIVVIGFANSVVFAQSQKVNPITLSRSDVACIIDNLDQFLSGSADPITVYLDICIGNKELEDVLSDSTRIVLPDVPKQRELKSTQSSASPRAVVLSKAHLRCLRSRVKEDHFYDNDPIVFDPTGCGHD